MALAQGTESGPAGDGKEFAEGAKATWDARLGKLEITQRLLCKEITK